MTHGSLFSGIGGFDLAAEWMGWENIFQVEWDKYCQKVLAKNFPNVKRYGDIKEFDGTKYRGLVDILTGGFPCQPFSVAGKQKGSGDDRYLWPERLRVIREVRAPFVVGENVPGIIRMELDNICIALEGEGYEVQPFIIPSASIGAWDKRERVWIIAYNHSFRCSNEQKENRQSLSNGIRINKAQEQKRGEQQCGFMQSDSIITDNNNEGLPQSGYEPKQQEIYAELGAQHCDRINSNINSIDSDNAGYNTGTISQQQKTEVQFNNIADTISSGRENRLHGRESERTAGECGNGFKKSDWWERDWIEVASELCRSNARIPNRMDRIKSLGNSVNPYVPYQIFKAIEQFNQNQNNETINSGT